MTKFAGRVVLVTGASRGIGLAIARRFASEGASLCLTARGADALAEAVNSLGPGHAIGVAGRSDDPAHRQEALSRIHEEFGRLDIVVNNVGVNPHYGRLVDLDLAAARKTLEVNLVASLGWVQDAERATREGIRGSVVNISSVTSTTASPGIAFYGATKAALESMTRALAVELAPRVRVNAVAPAVIETEFSRVLYEGRDALDAGYPLGRFGLPEDVAAAVAFLASDDASWFTGQTLIVDGGLLAAGGHA